MSGRPLDVLEATVGDEVTVRLKGGEIYNGTLAGYDQHMNLVLEDVVETHGHDPDEDSDARTPEEQGERTIIRGDNLVSISI